MRPHHPPPAKNTWSIGRVVILVLVVVLVSSIAVPSFGDPKHVGSPAGGGGGGEPLVSTPNLTPEGTSKEITTETPVASPPSVPEGKVEVAPHGDYVGPPKTPTPTMAPSKLPPKYELSRIQGAAKNDNNDGGQWVVKGEHNPGVVVVLGGSRMDAEVAGAIAEYGVTVWYPKVKYCVDESRPMCKPNVGFVQYMQDERPSTPRGEYTVFISAAEALGGGSGYITNVIADINTAIKTVQGNTNDIAPIATRAKRGTPATETTMVKTFEQFADFIGQFARFFHYEEINAKQTELAKAFDSRGVATQFAVRSDRLDLYSYEFYNTLYQHTLHCGHETYQDYGYLFSVMFTDRFLEFKDAKFLASSEIPLDTTRITYHQNEAGFWTTNPTAPMHKKDVLVVIGGGSDDASPQLVAAGFTVWKTRISCGKGGRCRENWGYIKYLNDRSGSRPQRQSVAFLHGHYSSQRHQRDVDLISLVADAAECAVRSERFTPIYRVPNFRANQHVASILTTFNKVFGEWKPIPKEDFARSNHICCAQHVIPMTLIDKNPPALYQAMDNFHEDPSCHGIWYELVWHLFFFEKTSIDVGDDTCEAPPSEDYLSVFESAGLTPSLKTNRFGVWPERSTYSSDLARRTLIITGLDYKSPYLPANPTQDAKITALTAGLLKHGYDVFTRRPAAGVHKGQRTHIRGYLNYLSHEERPMRDFLVFLRGDETLTPELLEAIERGVAKLGGGDVFQFLDFPGRVWVSPAPVAELLGEHGWSRINAARFCATGKWPTSPEALTKILPDVEGSQFVVKSSQLTARHPQCLTELMVLEDFDYNNKYTHLFHYYFRMLLGDPPAFV